MALRGTDPESYITDFTLIYENHFDDLAVVLPLERPLAWLINCD